jgi:hypothetical protein
MRTKAIICAFALLTLSSCNEEGLDQSLILQDEPVELTVSLPSVRTKVSEKNSPGTPNAVNTLQVFVFDDSNNLEAHDMADAESIVLSCRPGSKKVVTLVNAPELTDVRTYTQLAETRSLLTDNTIDSMVMVGEKDIELSATSSITVPVSRLASKIVLRQVVNNFKFKSDQEAAFTITGIYLLNVVGEKGYLSESQPELWYNRMELDTEDAPAFTYEQLSNNITIPYNGTYTADKYYYCYPNTTKSDSSGKNWSERYTRLVVEATLDGEVMYYPVSLPEVLPNSAYEISLKVTRHGSPDPDVPVSGVAAEFTIDVQDWIQRDRIEETI